MARTGTLEGFDAGHAVRLAQAAPDAVLALAQWIDGACPGPAMNGDGEQVVATRQDHSDIDHYEELTADGQVHAWTGPP